MFFFVSICRFQNSPDSRSINTFTVFDLSYRFALLVQSLRCRDEDIQLFQLYKAGGSCDTQTISNVRCSSPAFSTRRRNGDDIETYKRRVYLIISHSLMSIRYALFYLFFVVVIFRL